MRNQRNGLNKEKSEQRSTIYKNVDTTYKCPYTLCINAYLDTSSPKEETSDGIDVTDLVPDRVSSTSHL